MFFELSMMDARRDGHEEGHAEGVAEGRAEGFVEKGFQDVDRLAAEGTFTAEKACEILGVPLEDYKEHRRAMQ